MAWERRKGSRNRYYYRSVRRGKRVVKQYFGSGLAGQVAASLDASVRRDREQRAATVEACRARYATAQEPLNAFEDCLVALLRSALASVGYRYRYSRWRKCNAS
jgi:hypothetical protein